MEDVCTSCVVYVYMYDFLAPVVNVKFGNFVDLGVSHPQHTDYTFDIAQ